MEIKKCPRCKEVKPVSCFGNNSRTTDKLYPTCRMCVSEFQKRYRLNRIDPQTFIDLFVFANAMDGERFVPVKDFDDYRISDFGRVVSYNTKLGVPGFKTLQLDHKGYLGTILYSDNLDKRYTIHRLVALHFIPNPDNKPHINHKLGIKYDNYYKSLEWCTASENELHSYRVLNKNPTHGELHGNCKLSNKSVLEIREKYKPYKYTLNKLAKEYLVTETAIRLVVVNKRWRHI